MAITDPQSITVSAVTSSLPRTNTGNNKSEYTSPDGLIKLSASHAYGRRTRRVLRLDFSKVAADLYIPEQSRLLSMSNYIVWDLPAQGFTNAEALAVYTGFKTLYTASSDALVSKILGGEN